MLQSINVGTRTRSSATAMCWRKIFQQRMLGRRRSLVLPATSAAVAAPRCNSRRDQQLLQDLLLMSRKRLAWNHGLILEGWLLLPLLLLLLLLMLLLPYMLHLPRMIGSRAKVADITVRPTATAAVAVVHTLAASTC